MANVHGKDTEIWLGDTNISPYVASTSITVGHELADVTAYLDEDRNFIAGLTAGSISFTGQFDGAADTISDELTAALKTSTNLSVALGGSTLSNRWVGMAIQASSFEESNPVGDVVAFSYSANADDGTSRGTILHPFANVETGAGSETSVDQTASSALGCVGFLHVTAFTGSDCDIIIEDSSSDAGYATLLTFAQVTGVTSERVEVAAAADTPDRWVKVSFSGTFSSITFVVGMERI